jgi:hypothetical protein
MSEVAENNTREVAELIAEMEAYRERLVSETMENAKKAKLMKSQVMANLEPELEFIDRHLHTLREQQAALSVSN